MLVAPRALSDRCRGAAGACWPTARRRYRKETTVNTARSDRSTVGGTANTAPTHRTKRRAAPRHRRGWCPDAASVWLSARLVARRSFAFSPCLPIVWRDEQPGATPLRLSGARSPSTDHRAPITEGRHSRHGLDRELLTSVSVVSEECGLAVACPRGCRCTHTLAHPQPHTLCVCALERQRRWRQRECIGSSREAERRRERGHPGEGGWLAW